MSQITVQSPTRRKENLEIINEGVACKECKLRPPVKSHIEKKNSWIENLNMWIQTLPWPSNWKAISAQLSSSPGEMDRLDWVISKLPSSFQILRLDNASCRLQLRGIRIGPRRPLGFAICLPNSQRRRARG